MRYSHKIAYYSAINMRNKVMTYVTTGMTHDYVMLSERHKTQRLNVKLFKLSSIQNRQTHGE